MRIRLSIHQADGELPIFVGDREVTPAPIRIVPGDHFEGFDDSFGCPLMARGGGAIYDAAYRVELNAFVRSPCQIQAEGVENVCKPFSSIVFLINIRRALVWHSYNLHDSVCAVFALGGLVRFTTAHVGEVSTAARFRCRFYARRTNVWSVASRAIE